MIRDRLYIQAYCYIQAIVYYHTSLVAGERKNNFQSAYKVSKILGMALSVFAEVNLVF